MNTSIHGMRKPSLADTILDEVLSGEGQHVSLREAYVEITGDEGLSGRLKDCNELRMQNYLKAESARFIEAIDASTFANTLGSAVHRQMLRYYAEMPHLATWRKIVRTVPLDSFRQHTFGVIGGYGNLPAVTEGDGFQPLTSPADRAYTLALSKRGGTESITLETIANDDVGLVREIARELARAAAHTLSETVWDFLRTNPNVYDGAPLFSLARGNLDSVALSAAGLSGAYKAMTRRGDAALNRRAYVKPKFIAVPLDQEETAFNILQRNLNNDRNFIQTRGLEVVPVGYWTETDDWCLIGDPAAHPTIDVAFLGGNEEPELFVSDLPTGGSLFSHDAITLKIRHIYGAAVADAGAFYKSAP